MPPSLRPTQLASTSSTSLGHLISARRGGVIEQVDATRIVIRATEDLDPTKSGVDIYRLMKFQRSNQDTCLNQKPIIKMGDKGKKGQIIADGAATPAISSPDRRGVARSSRAVAESSRRWRGNEP